MARQRTGGRVSDTAAIAGKPSSGMTSHSIHTRKIDNGFVICEHSYNPETGECRDRESFSKSQPRIMPGKVAYGEVAKDGDLGDAVKYLGR